MNMLNEPLPGEKPVPLAQQAPDDEDDGFMSAMQTIGGG